MFGGGSIAVNRNSVLALSSVFGCVKILSETIASVPFEVLKKDDKGVRVATDHYLHKLIHFAPSDLYTSFLFRETLQGHLCLDGNAYARVYRNGAGRILRFEIISPNHIEPYLIDGEIWYKLQKPGGPVEILDSYDVIHIPAFGFDGIKGKNPIQVQRENMALGLSAQKFGKKFFENGAHVSGAITVPGKMKSEQKKSLGQRFRQAYSGVENTGGTVILDHGMEYKNIGIKPADASFIETRRFTTSDIARIYRVPLHMLAAMEKATFNNVEQLNINYVQYTIYPWVKRWEQEFNRKIFTDSEIKEGYRVRFNLSGLMRGDSKNRAEFYRNLYNIRALSPNEIRRLENMNPYKGGDEYGQPLASNSKDKKNGKDKS